MKPQPKVLVTILLCAANLELMWSGSWLQQRWFTGTAVERLWLMRTLFCGILELKPSPAVSWMFGMLLKTFQCFLSSCTFWLIYFSESLSGVVFKLQL